MRALLFILGLAALALVAALQFRLIDIDQTRPAVVQAPRFEADVARVSVGTENKTIELPRVDVEKPAADGR